MEATRIKVLAGKAPNTAMAVLLAASVCLPLQAISPEQGQAAGNAKVSSTVKQAPKSKIAMNKGNAKKQAEEAARKAAEEAAAKKAAEEEAARKAAEQNGVVRENGNYYYYVNGTMQRGWVKVGSNWCYCDTSTGIMKRNGEFFASTGYNSTGSGYRLFDSNGYVLYGWQNVNGAQYCRFNGGVLQRHEVVLRNRLRLSGAQHNGEWLASRGRVA